MSTQSVSTQGLHRVGRPAPRVVPARPGYLKMVPQRRPSTPRAPFVVVVVALLAAGLLGLLVLNTVLAQDAFRLHVLQKQGAALAGQELTLQRQVEARRAPADLAARAAALGLVPGGPPAFLRLSDGVVLGQPSPASPAPTPAPAPAGTNPTSVGPLNPDAGAVPLTASTGTAPQAVPQPAPGVPAVIHRAPSRQAPAKQAPARQAPARQPGHTHSTSPQLSPQQLPQQPAPTHAPTGLR